MYSFKASVKSIVSKYGICLLVLSVAAVFFILPDSAVQKTVTIETKSEQTAKSNIQSTFYGKVSVCEGMVTAYSSDGSVIKKTDVPLRSLPQELKAEIEKGIIAQSRQELFELLDSIDS